MALKQSVLAWYRQLYLHSDIYSLYTIDSLILTVHIQLALHSQQQVNPPKVKSNLISTTPIHTVKSTRITMVYTEWVLLNEDVLLLNKLKKQRREHIQCLLVSLQIHIPSL